LPQQVLIYPVYLIFNNCKFFLALDLQEFEDVAQIELLGDFKQVLEIRFLDVIVRDLAQSLQGLKDL